jgi:hypothetical protein
MVYNEKRARGTCPVELKALEIQKSGTRKTCYKEKSSETAHRVELHEGSTNAVAELLKILTQLPLALSPSVFPSS